MDSDPQQNAKLDPKRQQRAFWSNRHKAPISVSQSVWLELKREEWDKILVNYCENFLPE